MDAAELARRSILGFGEMLAVLGRCGPGAAAEVRRPGALGARIDAAAANPWFDAAVVPPGAPPPADDPQLPHCLWSVADAVPGRVEEPGGDVNERAYDDTGGPFGPLMRALRDDRLRTNGVRDAGAFVCVALTLTLGDDVSVQYVATEADHRRRGLARRLLLAVLAAARDEGMRSATLQASPDGLSVYERLGFRRAATLRAYLRPAAAP